MERFQVEYYFSEQEDKWSFGDSDDYFYEEVKNETRTKKKRTTNKKWQTAYLIKIKV